MSFMFHPYPYADPNAINRVDVPASVKEQLTRGILNVAKRIGGLFDEGVRTIGIDAYPGAEYEMLVNVLKQQLAAKGVVFVDAASVLLPSEVITAKVKPYLPEDREVDPVLLYGRRYLDGYKGLQDAEKVKKHGVEACRRRNLHYVSSDGKKQEEKCKRWPRR